MKLLEVAQKYIGTQEDAAHTNHGEQVTKWELEAGLPSGGYAWCQSFVYGCGLEAYGVNNPVPKTAGVLDCWEKAKAGKPKTFRKSNGPIDPALVKPGYQFILQESATAGHTGIIESVDADGTLHTIEGNSNNGGSREGYEVVRHTRHLTDKNLIGIIVYTD